MNKDAISFLLTCEHGGNRVPNNLASFFQGKKRLLESHRGWDFGALKKARALSRSLKIDLHESEISRLVVDLNRPLESKTLHFQLLNFQPDSLRDQILRSYYHPYRNAVVQNISTLLKTSKRVAHFSIHSFTPVLRGQVRDCEIGVLFDPSSTFEVHVAELLANSLQKSFPRARIRSNYPYQGRGEGQTTTLREKFGMRRYSGIELELNQAWLKRNNEIRQAKLLCAAFQMTIAQLKTKSNKTDVVKQ